MSFEKFVGSLQVQTNSPSAGGRRRPSSCRGGSARFQSPPSSSHVRNRCIMRPPLPERAQPQEIPSDESHQAGFFTLLSRGHISPLRHRTTSAGTWSWQRRYRRPRQGQSVPKRKYLQSSSWEVVLFGRKTEQAGCASLPSTYRPYPISKLPLYVEFVDFGLDPRPLRAIPRHSRSSRVAVSPQSLAWPTKGGGLV